MSILTEANVEGGRRKLHCLLISCAVKDKQLSQSEYFVSNATIKKIITKFKNVLIESLNPIRQ